MGTGRNSLFLRSYRVAAKFCGAVLLVGVPISLFWAAERALALDLGGVLAWLAMAAFLGVLGLYHWFHGEDDLLLELARRRRAGRKLLGTFGRRR